MKYRQARRAEETAIATHLQVCVEGEWVKDKLLNKDGKEIPLPHEIKLGETYLIEVDSEQEGLVRKYCVSC